MADVLAEEEMVEVGRWTTAGEAYEYALVVLAMQRDCLLSERDGGVALEVEPTLVDEVRGELRAYAEEQLEVREKADLAVGPVGTELSIAWALGLLSVFLLQLRDPGISDQYCNSSLGVFRSGEWWRPFTALFLHADAQHLAGNVFIGGVFCYFLAQTLGQWKGWVLILASGTLGNLLTAAVHYPEPFYSLGASTATFGALGLLVGAGLVLAWRSRSYRMLKPMMAPIAVGALLFGWFGVGGVDTDVLGHLFGMLSGVVLGCLATAGLRQFAGQEEQAG